MLVGGMSVSLDRLLAQGFGKFFTELLNFPSGRHDDQVDALGLISQLLDRMSNGTGARKVGTGETYFPVTPSVRGADLLCQAVPTSISAKAIMI
jgi:hypothetical protein